MFSPLQVKFGETIFVQIETVSLFAYFLFFLFIFYFLQILLPTVVMLMLIAVRTQVDTKVHQAQPYVFFNIGYIFLSRLFKFLISAIINLVTEGNEGKEKRKVFF